MEVRWLAPGHTTCSGRSGLDPAAMFQGLFKPSASASLFPLCSPSPDSFSTESRRHPLSCKANYSLFLLQPSWSIPSALRMKSVLFTMALVLFPMAARINYQHLVSENNTNSSSPSSGSQEFKIKMSTGLIPSWKSEGKAIAGPSPTQRLPWQLPAFSAP